MINHEQCPPFHRVYTNAQGKTEYIFSYDIAEAHCNSLTDSTLDTLHLLLSQFPNDEVCMSFYSIVSSTRNQRHLARQDWETIAETAARERATRSFRSRMITK